MSKSPPSITHQVLEVNLGAGSDRLGGTCDHYHDGDLYLSDSYGDLCDGPLKAKTSYRYLPQTLGQSHSPEMQRH